jgi:hypothetical protein
MTVQIRVTLLLLAALSLTISVAASECPSENSPVSTKPESKRANSRTIGCIICTIVRVDLKRAFETKELLPLKRVFPEAPIAPQDIITGNFGQIQPRYLLMYRRSHEE